jgi:hypothetical protein
MAIYRGDGGAGVANPTYETAVIADQTGNSGKYLTTDGSLTSWVVVAGTGTVTSASVVSANGFAGTVATATTTPAITLTTSITGVLKGNGTAISAATSGTDYAPATSGTSILYGNGSGGFSNVTVGSGLTFSTGTLSASGGGNLDGLTDVTITSPTTGQVLKYNGTIWVNDTDSTGSGSFTYPGAGIAVSTGSAWGTSLTDNSANWDSAYTDRLKWDGGATGLTASTGRTSLGLGTAATMTGPSGTIVGTTDTQTLSAKTLTTPIISSISNTGTLTLPTSTDTLVGRATTDTLTNKTLTSPTMIGTLIEDVFTITDGAGFAIDPDNGSIQLVTLGANRTPTVANFAAGEAVTLMINDGTAYTITWTTIGVVWVGGTAPTLATTGYTVVELWRVGSTYYGALVGNVA